jgi:hypothetical protein
MAIWQWILANPAKTTAGVLLFLKWVYNAWTPGVTFPQFIRNLIGEAVQESPSNLATLPAAEKQAVMAVRVKEAESGKPTS